MTAEKMFEELGFHQIHDHSADVLIEYIDCKERYNGGYYGIRFHEDGSFECYVNSYNNDTYSVSPKMLKAIIKQIEEMWWL
jgi:hypothetical protein